MCPKVCHLLNTSHYILKYLNFNFFSLPVSAITITVGQLSLNQQDPYEVRYGVLSVELYMEGVGYDETTGLHNIALLQVITY